jgi:hypothetical protein
MFELLEDRRLLTSDDLRDLGYGGYRADTSFGAVPLYFEQNVGQAAEDVAFMTRGDAYIAAFSRSGEVSFLLDGPEVGSQMPDTDGSPGESSGVTMRFIGAAPSLTSPGDPVPGVTNYLIGPDAAKWLTDVPHYGTLRYTDVYPGIDVEFYGNGQRLEFDLLVAPDVDPTSIQIGFTDVDSVDVAADGALVVSRGGQELAWEAPLSYQLVNGERVSVETTFTRLNETTVGFEVGPHDASRLLVIDPSLSYSTYFGGAGFDVIADVAVQNDGRIVLVGSGPNPAATPGTLIGPRGDDDMFVARLNPEGTAIDFLTVIGGSGTDSPRHIQLDQAGNILIAGETTSADFPTVKPTQAVNGGGTDAFVAILNSAGNTLTFSTYLGGAGTDIAHDLAVNPTGNNVLYVVGDTGSAGLATAGVLQAALAGDQDAFVARFTYGVAPARDYFTYLGGDTGAGVDTGRGIAVNAAGEAFVTGGAGAGLHTTGGVIFPALAAGGYGQDAFVARLNGTGAAAVYVTYLGGNGTGTGFQEESGVDIVIDASDNAYVTGSALPNFPTTPGAYDSAFNDEPGRVSDPLQDVFIAKVNATGTSLDMSTLLGGGRFDYPAEIALDATGNIYVAGETESVDFPVLQAIPDPAPNDPTRQGGDTYAGWLPPTDTAHTACGESFVTQLTPDGSAVLFSTYVTGSSCEASTGLAVSGGTVFVAGLTNSTDFMRAGNPNRVQDTLGGDSDGFLIVLVPDTDGDGLWDDWEKDGIPVAGGGTFTLPDADPLHKDLYVEVDAIDGYRPASIHGIVTGATNTRPIVITSPNHGLTTGSRVVLRGVGGVVNANNTVYTVGAATQNTFELQGSNGIANPPYQPGTGAWQLSSQAITKITLAAPVVITTADRHGLATGMRITVQGVAGVLAANGSFDVRVLDARTFELVGSSGVGSAAYTPDTGSWQLADVAGTVSTNTSLDFVVDAFAKAPVTNPDKTTGITLHIQLDDLDIRGTMTTDFNGDGNPDGWSEDVLRHELDRVKGGLDPAGNAPPPGNNWGFGTDAERANAAIVTAKRQAYRYALFGLQRQGGSPGVSWVWGQDVSINWGQGTFQQYLADTFMHEFGHSLGLSHAGAMDVRANYYPNYFSMMNYTWSHRAEVRPDAASPDQQAFWDSWGFRYSNAALPTLDESKLDESDGIQGDAKYTVAIGPVSCSVSGKTVTIGNPRYVSMAGAVNFNNANGIEEGTVAADVNWIGGDYNNDKKIDCSDASPNEVLRGYDDWANLKYRFTDSPSFARAANAVVELDPHFGLELLETVSPVMVYPVPAGASSVNLTLRRSGDWLELIDNATVTVVDSRLLSDTDTVYVYGYAGRSEHLTVDFASGGFFAVPRIYFDGNVSGNDSLSVIGTGATNGRYEPAYRVPGDGVVTVEAGGVSVAVDFRGLEPITVAEMANFTLVTPGSEDVITFDVPATGQNRVSGTSDGVGFESMTYYNITNLTVDAAANDGASPNDIIDIAAPGLVASGLQSLAIRTGSGDDSLSIVSDRLSLPLGNVELLFDAGSGTDRVTVSGDADYRLTDDVVTSSRGGAGRLSGVERATLNGGPSDNVLDASGFTLGPVDFFAGAGDDTIVGSPSADNIDGGAGFDTLVVRGTQASDQITVAQTAADKIQTTFGASPSVSDTLATVAGSATVEGVRIEGLAGDDLVTIDSATRPLLLRCVYEGGVGTDVLRLSGGTATADSYVPGPRVGEGISQITFSSGGGGVQTVRFVDLAPVVDLVAASSLTVYGTPGDDTISVEPGSAGPPIQGRVSINNLERIDFANKETLVIDAGAGSDAITVSIPDANRPASLTGVTVNADGPEDTFSGNDRVTLLALPLTASGFTGPVAVNGGPGDDDIDGSALAAGTPGLTVTGGAGNDTLSGGPAADTLRGGLGNDTLVYSPGGDTFDGANVPGGDLDPRTAISGYDTLVIRGTPDNDVMDAVQLAPSGAVGGNYTLNYTFNTAATVANVLVQTPAAVANTAAGARPTVEEVRLEAGAGNDLIRVAHADAYTNAAADADGLPSQMVRFNVLGDAPNASDRLVVQDLGLGDLVLVRQGPDERSGRVTIAPALNTGLGETVYSGIERLDISPLNDMNSSGTILTPGTGTGGQGRIVVFEQDPFELNDIPTIATDINDVFRIDRNPTIDPGGVAAPPFAVPGDEDWYQFLAPKTGTFTFSVLFSQIGTLANGRAGLPGDGNLDAQLYNANGSLIATSNGIVNNETLAATVAAGQRYFLRVLGAPAAGDLTTQSASPAINVYDLTVQETDRLGPQAFDPDGLGPNQAIQITSSPTFDLFANKQAHARSAVAAAPIPTATTFAGGPALSAVNGAYVGMLLRFTSGALAGQTRTITAYNGTTKLLTVGTPFAAAPLAGATFDIVAAGPTPLVGSLTINFRDLPAPRAPGNVYEALNLTTAAAVGNYQVAGDANGMIPIQTVTAINDALTGQVVAAPVPTPVAFSASDTAANIAANAANPTMQTLLHTTPDYYTGATLRFTSGALAGQSGTITAYTAPGGIPTFAFAAGTFTGAPAATDTFEILAPVTGRVILTFASPLPDDRFTLTVDDSVRDPAGNRLDGESNTEEPNAAPRFPSGDGQSDGDFVARFTVDSRPELGTWGSGNVWVDTNGNFHFDPTNLDFVNRDIPYAAFGFTSDDVFAGDFSPPGPASVTDHFDKLAAYGRVGTAFRVIWDTDNDGIPNFVKLQSQPINGLPAAGDFDGLSGNGEELVVFASTPTSATWYLDTNHDFDVADVGGSVALPAAMRGLPIVGDFNGDGFDDLATWRDDTFFIDLSTGVGPLGGLNGTVDATFRLGVIGVRERPVAADLNQDGYDDVGLWVPASSGVTPADGGEWYWLVSGTVRNNDPAGPAMLGPSLIGRIVVDSSVNPGGATVLTDNVVRFTPVPFGNDLYAQFADGYAVPLVGNFDPPASPDGDSGGAASAILLYQNPLNAFDVNADGVVTALDVLVVISRLNDQGAYGLASAEGESPMFWDVNGDGAVTSLDALLVVNQLNGSPAAGSIGEGEAGAARAASLFASLSASSATAATFESEPTSTPAPPADPLAASIADRNELTTLSAVAVDATFARPAAPRRWSEAQELDEFLSSLVEDVSGEWMQPS